MMSTAGLIKLMVIVCRQIRANRIAGFVMTVLLVSINLITMVMVS